jgi:hypothetical protein
MAHEVDHEVLLSLECEQTCCVVKYGGKNVLCGAMYRPPGIKLGRENTVITKSLKFASAAKFDDVILCGDFNHPTIS